MSSSRDSQNVPIKFGGFINHTKINDITTTMSSSDNSIVLMSESQTQMPNNDESTVNNILLTSVQSLINISNEVSTPLDTENDQSSLTTLDLDLSTNYDDINYNLETILPTDTSDLNINTTPTTNDFDLEYSTSILNTLPLVENIETINLKSSTEFEADTLISTQNYYDLEITTAEIKLDIDTLDPTKIARATSYETSQLATVSRSATVTTKVKSIINHHNDDNPYIISNETDPLNSLPVLESSVNFTPGIDESSITTITVDTNELEKVQNNFVLNIYDNVNTRRNPTEYQIHIQTNKTQIDTPNWDIFQNSTRLENLGINTNNYTTISSNLLIGIGIISSLVLIICTLIILLWFFKRHKNHSKIYLSLEAAKPRAFLTKPMSPVCFPNEVDIGVVIPSVNGQKPRAPIVLCDNDNIELDKIVSTVLKHANSEDSGLDNLGFVEIPLENIESNTPNTSLGSQESQLKNPPRYRKNISDSDSGIRVWSSSGSLYSVSPRFTRCAMPPPTYIPQPGEKHIYVEEPITKWKNKTPNNCIVHIAGLHNKQQTPVKNVPFSSSYDNFEQFKNFKIVTDQSIMVQNTSTKGISLC